MSNIEPIPREVLKPSVLYHGTTLRNVKELTPQNKSYRDLQEGPVVFASSRKDLATCFCLPTDDSWVKIGVSDSGKCQMLISDQKRFSRLDEGGVVYTLPSSTFYCDPKKGMGDLEWVSKAPVVPMGRTEYEKVLDGMIQEGVEVFFTDPATFQTYAENREKRDEILKGLVSENQRREIEKNKIKSNVSRG